MHPCLGELRERAKGRTGRDGMGGGLDNFSPGYKKSKLYMNFITRITSLNNQY